MSLKLLLTTDAVGGVWQYSLELAAALAAHDIETLLAVFGPAPSPDQRLALEALGPGLGGVTLIETGLPLDWLCDGPEPVRAAGHAIADLAAREGVDLVQLNMPTLAADVRFTVPVVAVTHGCVATWWAAARSEPLAPAYHWHRAMMARGLAAADRVVAPSHAYAAIVAAAYDLPAVPHAVRNGRSLPAPAPLPLPLLRDEVLTVGRLWDGVKNARLLDQVAADLTVPFHAAGAVTGPHGETIAFTHLRALGEISGSALAARLAARPVFVSAASFEPFGLAVLEAAAAGCALVLSDIPTFRELWDDAALFVARDDVAGYRTAIERLIGDATLRQAMGDAAHAQAGRYTPARTAAAMQAIYTDLVSASARRVAA